MKERPQDRSEAGTLPGAGRRVAVIGARTLLDDAAAELLAQAMRARGAETLVLPHRALPGPSLRDFGAETVVIAALDGAARPSVAVAAAPRPLELAQVLLDTDDAWDDMLNALEADGPSSPV